VMLSRFCNEGQVGCASVDVYIVLIVFLTMHFSAKGS
jgi:hypothetical protein